MGGTTRKLAGCIAFCLSTCLAQVADLSGTWDLNLDKSSWGQVQKPLAITVTIEHREPAIRYTGTIVYAAGEDTRTFSFQGAIDGKEYPITRSFGSGKIRIRRVNARTTESVFRSDDGQWEEVTRTSISVDGKTLRREIRRKGPPGELRWTEVYDKR